MKAILFVAAALLLAACEDDTGWVPDQTVAAGQPPVAVAPSVTTAPPATTPPPAPDVSQTQPQIAAAPNPVDTHCRAVAHQREADARANGFSFEMSDLVYEGTYKDCVAWQTQHRE